jgi:hypothetical protein
MTLLTFIHLTVILQHTKCKQRIKDEHHGIDIVFK